MKNLFLSAIALTAILTLGSCSKDDNGGGGSGSASVSSLNCATAIVNGGTPTQGTVFSGSATISYSGGNGASYSAATVNSTGVTGLTATLIAGTLNSGAGVLTYLLTGTPASSGTATFPISFGGQSCNLTLTVNAPVNLPFAGKWMYQYMRDSMYNFQQLYYNNTYVLDSVVVRNYVGTIGYFQFNNDYTYTWQTATAGSSYTGNFTTDNNTGYGYGVTIKCRGISTSAPPNDTTRFYIWTLNSPNMTIERFFYSINANNDTIAVDRFYDLLK